MAGRMMQEGSHSGQWALTPATALFKVATRYLPITSEEIAISKKKIQTAFEQIEAMFVA